MSHLGLPVFLRIEGRIVSFFISEFHNFDLKYPTECFHW